MGLMVTIILKIFMYVAFKNGEVEGQFLVLAVSAGAGAEAAKFSSKCEPRSPPPVAGAVVNRPIARCEQEQYQFVPYARCSRSGR